jgi:hypothetical protein
VNLFGGKDGLHCGKSHRLEEFLACLSDFGEERRNVEVCRSNFVVKT